MAGELHAVYVASMLLTALPISLSQLAVDPSNTTAVRGNHTTLICQVQDTAVPFRWLEYVTSSTGHMIYNNQQGASPGNPDHDIIGTYDLRISNLELIDGGMYGCAIETMAQPKVASLIILDNPSILIPDLVENMLTYVECSAFYGGPAPGNIASNQKPNLRIYVDDQDQGIVPNLTPGRPPQDGVQFMASTLKASFNYTPILEHDGREVRCEILTSQPVMSLSSSTTLSIKYAVRDLTINPLKQSYLIGEVINCTASGNPDPEIAWDPEDTNLPHNPGSVLTVMEGMVGDNTWICVATNNPDVVRTIETQISFVVENEAVSKPGGSACSTYNILCIVTAIWAYYGMT